MFIITLGSNFVSILPKTKHANNNDDQDHRSEKSGNYRFIRKIIIRVLQDLIRLRSNYDIIFFLWNRNTSVINSSSHFQIRLISGNTISAFVGALGSVSEWIFPIKVFRAVVIRHAKSRFARDLGEAEVRFKAVMIGFALENIVNLIKLWKKLYFGKYNTLSKYLKYLLLQKQYQKYNN